MILHYCNDEDDFEYDIDSDEALEHLLSTYSKEQLIKLLLDELDVQHELEEYFYDDILDYHRDEAWESYADALEYERDPLGYYGMSIHDFI